MSEKMEVIITGTRNLYPWFPCMYASLFDHDPNAHLWIFAEDAELPYKTPDNCTVVDVSKQTMFKPDGPNARSPFTYMAMIRAAFPLLFNGDSYGGVPELPKLDRLISMDVDVVVCDSLKPIWDVEFPNGEWLAAVPQFISDNRPYGRRRYFNAGITVYNLEQMRIDGVGEKAIELLNKSKFQFLDEMVLNLLNMAEGETKILPLPPKWNQHLEVPQTIKNVGVIHYAGERCVWQQDLDLVYRGHYLKPWLKYSEEDSCRRANIKF